MPPEPLFEEGSPSRFPRAAVGAEFEPHGLKPIAWYLKAVWLEMFGPVLLEISAEIDPRELFRSPGPAPHINLHEKTAPQTNSKDMS